MVGGGGGGEENFRRIIYISLDLILITMYYYKCTVGGEDYVPILDQQLTFTPTTPGNIICFNLTTLTDNRLEPRENLFLNLVSDDLAILLIPRRAEVRIDDINRELVTDF